MALGGYAYGKPLPDGGQSPAELERVPGHASVPTPHMALSLYARGDRRWAELQGVTLDDAMRGFATWRWYGEGHVGVDGTRHTGHYIFYRRGTQPFDRPTPSLQTGGPG